MEKIVPAFKNSLFEKLDDIGMEIAEVGIDSILDEGLLKEIPIVSTFRGIIKIGYNLHDRHLLKQSLAFIQSFNNKTISEEKLSKYKEKISSDPKKAEEELERVLLVLSSLIEGKSSSLLGIIFAAYIEGKIDWEKFCELAEVVRRLFICDLHIIYDINDGIITDTTQCPNYQADRLISLGLLNSSLKTMMHSSTSHYIQLSELGNLFCELTKETTNEE